MNQFKNGNGSTRSIVIEITENYIEFYFLQDLKRHKEFIEYMDSIEQEISEDEKTCNTFYYIPKEEWIKDKTQRLDREDNWNIHMYEKNWFTKEMELFINKNCF